MKSIELSILPFSSCDRAEMSLQLDGAREWYEDVREVGDLDGVVELGGRV